MFLRIFKVTMISFSYLIACNYSLAATTSPKTNNQKFYVGPTLGYAEPTSFKNNEQLQDSHGTANYGILAGTYLQDWFRTGVEITHRHKQTVSSTKSTAGRVSFENYTAFLNGYFMIPEKNSPYLLLGLGVAHNKLGNYNTANGTVNQSNNVNKFAYQVGVGMTSNYKNFSFDGEVKYADKGEAKTKTNSSGGTLKADIKDLIFSIAVRYNFS